MSPLYPPEWDEIEAPAMSAELPGARSREILDRAGRTGYAGLIGDLMPFCVAEKNGWTVTDVDGNVFVDCISSSASVPLGAGRSEILDPAIAEIERIGNEDSHSYISALTADLGDRLLEVTPKSLTRFDIALNGTEAVEIAVKMMRRATGRPIILAFHGSYHGESTTTAALGAESVEIAAGLRALVPGFAHVPYPHPYRTPFKAPRPGGSGDSTVDFIRDHLLFHAVDPADVAGVVIEPVLGSGGCVAPPDTFWPALTELCREHDWLLCADEVKSGMGRTGTLFAVEHWGVEPDLMCLGKGLGGGVMPIGALLGNERVLGEVDDVPTGSTWAWLPGSCAAALATLDVFATEPVLENVAALQKVAEDRLGKLREAHEEIGDVRAVGCLQAIEFVTDRETHNLDSELQHAVGAEMVRRGVLADSSSTSLNIQPSLVMPPERLAEAYDVVGDAIEAAKSAR